MRLIHCNGATLKIDDGPTVIDQLEAKPRFVVPKKPLKARHCRPEWKIVHMPKAHTNYQPGMIYDLGEDQCRWVLDEHYVMCGKRKHGKSAYCQHHHERTVDKTQGKRLPFVSDIARGVR